MEEPKGGLEFNGECRIPVYRYGLIYGTRSVGPHDWRLHERTAVGQPSTASWRETWYCTRCRLVETREVPA